MKCSCLSWKKMNNVIYKFSENSNKFTSHFSKVDAIKCLVLFCRRNSPNVKICSSIVEQRQAEKPETGTTKNDFCSKN